MSHEQAQGAATLGLGAAAALGENAASAALASQTMEMKPIITGPHPLGGLLVVPPAANALVIFGHGSGTSRLGPSSHVARQLERSGFAALFLDLLSPEEEGKPSNISDIDLLASRLTQATEWARCVPELRGLPIGYFGATSSGGAAIIAAAMNPAEVRAIVLLGGRPDLAGEWLSAVKAPTLLLVGSHDPQVLEINHVAVARMKCTVELCLIPGAGQSFDGRGALDYVDRQTRQWFNRYLNPNEPAPIRLPSSDCRPCRFMSDCWINASASP